MDEQSDFGYSLRGFKISARALILSKIEAERMETFKSVEDLADYLHGRLLERYAHCTKFRKELRAAAATVAKEHFFDNYPP